MIKQRNIALCVVFSILTCGIYYYFYWRAVLVDDMNYAANEPDTSGIGVALLSLVTCDFFWIYFVYKMGRKLNAAWQRKGRSADPNLGMICMILSIFRLDIITMCLLQNELNHLAVE